MSYRKDGVDPLTTVGNTLTFVVVTVMVVAMTMLEVVVKEAAGRWNGKRKRICSRYTDFVLDLLPDLRRLMIITMTLIVLLVFR